MSFGLWWLMNPPNESPLDLTLPDKFFGKVTDLDKIMKPLSQIADFDIYHLLKGNVDPQMGEVDGWLKQAQNKRVVEFASKFKKAESSISKVIENIKTLHSAIIKGRMKKEFRQIIESNKIPKEALYSCTGLVIDDLIVDAENVLNGIHFKTETLSVLQLACMLGQQDIFSFLVNDMNLRNKRDFSARKQTMIHEKPFIFVPILKKHAAMLKELLNIPTLWTLEDLKDMIVLCK